MNIAIVGNGICGITAARFISGVSPKDKIYIFTDEKYNYYPRPQLDQLLSEKIDLNRMFPYNEEWFKNRNIEVNLGHKIKTIDISSKRIISEEGAVHNYDKLLLAAGSSSFVPQIEGVTNEGVFTYRNIDDVLRIRSYARGKKKAVVIGGGLLGLETAHALISLGLKVSVVERGPWLLPRQLDEEGAKILRLQVERAKIEVVLKTTCDQILAEGAKKCLLSKEIGKLDADLFIISAGVRPNTGLAKDAGINTDKGIVVDKNMHTSREDIFAAGDCAEFNGLVYGIIPAAIEQGNAAASNMIDRPLDYNGTTFQTTLKVMRMDLTSIGEVNPKGADYEEVKKKDVSRCFYRKVVIRDGCAVGAIILGDKRGIAELAKIIKEKIDVSKNKEALLGDENVLRQTFLSKGA